jgi:hypothetical protein
MHMRSDYPVVLFVLCKEAGLIFMSIFSRSGDIIYTCDTCLKPLMRPSKVMNRMINILDNENGLQGLYELD